MESIMLLKDPEISPSAEILKTVMGEPLYNTMDELMLATSKIGLTPEWRYYNDGKAWLCKISFKKKTVVWISVWDGFFKTGIYFTEKHREAINNLHIADSIKQSFSEAKPIGKLIPITLDISKKEQLRDLLTIIDFKKGN